MRQAVRAFAGSIGFEGSIEYFFDAAPDTDDDLPEDAYGLISLAAHELGHVLGFTASLACTTLEEGRIAATQLGEASVGQHEGLPIGDCRELS